MRVTIAGREYEAADKIRERLEEIASEYPGRAFPEDTQAEWDTLNAALDREQQRNERLRELARSPRHREEIDARPGPQRDATNLREQALVANERASFLPDKALEHMERMLRKDDDPQARLAQATVALSDRSYFRAFAKWMRDPVSGGHEWTNPERDAVQRVRWLERAMALGAGGTGGFLVPYELDPAILIASAGTVSPLREIARVVTTAQNEKRFVTSLGVTASWDLEAEEVSDDSPALLQPTITCKKGAAFVPVSIELFEDSRGSNHPPIVEPAFLGRCGTEVVRRDGRNPLDSSRGARI